MATTKLDLTLATGAGYFSTVKYEGTTSTETTGENAVFNLNSVHEPGENSLGTVAASGSTYELTDIAEGITDVTAQGSTKKWTISTEGASGLKTLVGSDQADDIIAVNGADGFTITTGSGKDTIDITGLKVDAVAADYDYASDVIVVGEIEDATEIINSNGTIEANGVSLKLNATSGYYKAVVGDGDKTYDIWKGGSDAAVLDASSESNSLIMVTGEKADTLLGGSKADSIYATVEGAYAFGGAGTDLIELEDEATATRQYVAISTDSGKDSVVAFDAGFADTDDVLVLRDGSIADLKFTPDATATNGTVVKNDGGSVSVAGADATNNLQILIQEGTADVSQVAVVNATGAGYTLVDGNDIADYYISTNKVGKVDFTAIDDDVVVELSNAGNYEDGATFVGIDSVVGGTGNTTLVGDGETKNTLTAGTGNTTLWGGGASNDTLIGNAAAADAFFVAQYDGKDSISGFTFGTGDTADTLYMLNSPVASIKKDTSNTTFTFADGSSVALATGTATSTVQFSLDGTTTQVAAIGKSSDDNSFTYSSDVDMYFGGSRTNTLKVDSTYDGTSVDIRLNNTMEQTYSNVNKVTASMYDGKAFLSGSDESSEALVGGTGRTTLWGGLGAVADTLTGTNGDVTEFYFGKDNGEDIVTSSDSDDKVVFYDFANTDLTAIDTSGSQLKFTFNDGSSLQLQNYTSSSAQTFEFNNSSWTYDKASRTFTQTK